MAGAIAAGVIVAGSGRFRPVDMPHRLAGKTLLDGQPVSRRVEVRCRRTGKYIISTVTDATAGTFEFTGLPPQSLSRPYIITCFDDSDTPGNALVFDLVYQLDDNGNPPQT